MKKFKRYYKPEGWNFKNNFLNGTEWEVISSKSGSVYVVALTSQGFECDCQGFTFKGKCKHTTQIAEKFDDELS